MRKRFDFDIKKNYCLLLSPVITGIVLLCVYILGGIYPFGDTNVEYYDMAQGIIPNFYHIWDALHSDDTALWFNWYSGLGVNDTANASLSVFWAVLLLLPRRLVGKAMSLYVLLFMCLSAFSACVFLRRAENTKPFISTLLSVCYAFCGFSVMYYTNAWQDTVFLFPLFMLSWLALMKKGKILPYILMIFLNLLCGYYVFTLVIVYIFFLSFLYLTMMTDRKARKQRAFELGFSTLTGYGISSFFFVPKMIQTLSSERFTEETGFDFSALLSQYIEIAKTTECKSPDKWAMLFCTALPAAIIVLGILKNKKAKRENGFFVLSVLLLAVLIVCEGANELMHFGDYNYFPMRMGYALTFAFIWSAGHYSKFLQPCRIPRKSDTGKKAFSLIINILFFAVLFGFVYLIMKKLDAAYDFQYSCLYALPVLFVIYLLLLSKSNRLFDYRLSASALLAEITVLSMLFIPYAQTDKLDKEHDPAYIAASQTLVKKLDIESSETARIKTVGTTLNCNYGTVMERAAIADWTHLVPGNIQSSLMALGYSGEYTRIHDSGGTAFTDALLGVTELLSVKEESSALYTEKGTAKGYHYYSCNYTLPYGIAVDESILDISVDDGDWKELNNRLYTCLSGDSEPLVTQSEMSLVSSGENTETYRFTSREGTTAYFRLRGARNVRIYVNGEKLTIPTVGQKKNAKYPGRFNRDLISLGEFGDSEIEITLEYTGGKFEDKEDFRQNDYGSEDERNQSFYCEVGLLDLAKLEAVCDLYNTSFVVSAQNYTLDVQADNVQSGMVLLLPLQYNGCWSAKVNSEKATVQPVLDLLCAVELRPGENDVEMRFTPTGFYAGLIATAVFIVLLAAVLLFRRRERPAPVLYGAAYGLYGVLFAAGAVLMYIIPVFLLIYQTLSGFIGR